MAEALKHMFSRPLLERFSSEVQAVYPDFARAAFFRLVFDDNWENLELKQRIRHIARCLGEVLPGTYADQVAVLLRTVEHLIGREGEKMSFEYMFLPDFVEIFGVDEPEVSLPALETITRWSSAEFAVRPFFLRYPERMYRQMLVWADHESAMVRRLSSEGFRPRLPWGAGVPVLKKDPSPILPVLEKLKNDPAETVRRSVANNLNDIAKDHPELVLDIARRWNGHSPETDWVLRHACRSLLKKGHSEVLAHFGFEHGAEGLRVENLQHDARVRVGEVFHFAFDVHHAGAEPLRLRLEYRIDYITSTGKTSSKVFKIKEITLSAGQMEPVARRQRFQDFTTRKHYPGRHRLAILCNGKELAEGWFEVL